MLEPAYLPPRINTTSPLSPAELRFALRASRIGTWALDLYTKELVTSEACKLNFGRDVDLPFSYAELLAAVHPDDQSRMRDAVAASIRSGEEYEIEYRLLTPKGETRWAYIRAQTSFSARGTPETLFGVSVDTTERRRAETALREATDRLALVTELAGVEFWEVNLFNHQLILPARMRAMMGLSTDGSIGTRAVYRAFNSEDRVRALAAFQAAVDPLQRAPFELECRLLKPLDAKVQCVLIKGRGIFDGTGRCLRMMGIVKDASDPCEFGFRTTISTGSA